MAVDARQVHADGRRRRVERRRAIGHALTGQSFWSQPRPRIQSSGASRARRARATLAIDLGERRGAAQVDLLQLRAEAEEVAVRVVQAGQDGAAAGVDDPRRRVRAAPAPRRRCRRRARRSPRMATASALRAASASRCRRRALWTIRSAGAGWADCRHRDDDAERHRAHDAQHGRTRRIAAASAASSRHRSATVRAAELPAGPDGPAYRRPRQRRRVFSRADRSREPLYSATHACRRCHRAQTGRRRAVPRRDPGLRPRPSPTAPGPTTRSPRC